MKKLLAMALSGAMALSLVACGGSGSTSANNESNAASSTESAGAAEDVATSGEKVKITYLNGFTGGDGDFMRKITDGFNASQDKYEVIESQEKDHMTGFKANGADLVVIAGASLYTYAEDGMIQEVSAVYEKAGIEKTEKQH